ncbi:hypothetical protein V1477_001031 [Vespula maculifrons]|uniref:Uncharacterized protein n=1 Tax=Vespula maculifrons TaxID=7453 RepID=A0ABD2D0L0_VESMC
MSDTNTRLHHCNAGNCVEVLKHKNRNKIIGITVIIKGCINHSTNILSKFPESAKISKSTLGDRLSKSLEGVKISKSTRGGRLSKSSEILKERQNIDVLTLTLHYYLSRTHPVRSAMGTRRNSKQD